MLTKIIYLAGNLGFSELGRYSLEMFKTHLSSKFNIFDPFEVNSRLGDKISSIEKEEFRSIEEITNYPMEITYLTRDLHHGDFSGNIMTEFEEKFYKQGKNINKLTAVF